MSGSTFATTYLLTAVDTYGDTLTATLTTTSGLTSSTITGATGAFNGTSITGVTLPSVDANAVIEDNILYPTEAAKKTTVGKKSYGPYQSYVDHSGLFVDLSNGYGVNLYATGSGQYSMFTVDSYGNVGPVATVTTLNLTPVISAGQTASLTAAATFTGVDNFGTLVLSAPLTGPVNMEGNGAQSVVDFTSTSGTATLTNFGASDGIILGSAVLPTLPAGDSIALNYSGSVLTVGEVNATGTTVSSAKVTVSGVAGTSLSSASFIALQGTAGENIELVSGLSGQTFTFTGAQNNSFENPANFTGGIAPGDSLVAGETVTIATGTASVSGSGLVDNGTINVGTSFVDTGSVTGSGTLNVNSGANATLTGNTTLGSITDAGTLVLGGNDAASITLASGAQATIAANFSDSKAISGAGTLTVNSGVTATLAGGSSVASILDNGTLDLAGSLGGTINMSGNNAGSVADFTGTDVTNHVLNTTITNFGTGDSIIVGPANFSLSGTNDKLTESYSNGTLVVTDATDGASVTIDVSLASGDSANWLTLNESTGTLTLTLCFYPGTRLATADGEIEVEALRAGDVVMTVDGAKQVRWIGQSHVHTRFADPLRSLPICIKAGALGDGLPRRDLRLSPDHAVFIDGILVQAAALVNGESIVRDYDVPEQFTYYHVELASHELLLAEGVPAESFVDNVDRMHFHNWEEREAPAEAIEEMAYPRAKSARQVPMAIRRRLSGISAQVA
ncbi:Hint domain-containing protein [Acidocella sp. KAb 2-4]|uniref:Hint domain-containing protein n=1 Tax=Acidocella sp. KAb 2-4 TaxID=2885158 RepID=UPI001D060858|nr:Hint domain-containing protein [Acidocella sp. KAb 2-4]